MKKNRFAIAAILVAVAIMITACGKHEEAPHPPTAEEQRANALAKSAENAKLQDLLEQQRSTALSNATKNAAAYFAVNPRFDNSWTRIPHTDDLISPSCPQGSGWTWVNIMRVQGKEVDKKKIWCSTSSQSLGCYIEDDFVKGPHAGEQSKCDPNLPHPLKPFN